MLDSPYRLTALIFAGSLLACAGFLGSSFHPIHTSLPLLLLTFALVVVGLLIMFWAANTLRDDNANERWPEATLAPFRAVTTHVLWNITMGLLVLAMFAALTQDRHHRSWFWAIFVLLQTQTQLTTAFARPRKPTRPSPLLDWSKVAPLQSEHWGKP